MPEEPQCTLHEVREHLRETALLESTRSLLHWDERTKLPPVAGAYRAEQITHLTGMIHRRRTDPRLGAWLDELSDSSLMREPHSDPATTIRQLRRDYQKHVKLPQQLVEELSRETTIGQQVWVEARRKNDFSLFRPQLEKIVQLKRQQAEAIGYDQCLYDALLDDFEPDAKTHAVAEVLERLRLELVPLVGAIRDSGRRPDRALLKRHYPAARQEQFGLEAAARIGFNFQRGRLDITHHPFCSELGPDDCRITTRYDEHHFPGGFFGILHEAGHGIYEQGLRRDQFGLPPGSAISLGIHESQSRMWENLVGRSLPFWQFFFERAQRQFPESLGDVPLDAFYFAINDVEPSLIRVEADEATYNLHIIIRFQLEQAVLEGQLAVADLPAAWREKYEQFLGITPPDDAQGVMQDIHWSAGLFGYFPTYTLGNLYAGQLFAAAAEQLGDWQSQFAQGDFQPLHQWLTEQIYRRGQCYTAAELVELVTGQPLDHRALMRHLRGKLEPLFGLN